MVNTIPWDNALTRITYSRGWILSHKLHKLLHIGINLNLLVRQEIGGQKCSVDNNISSDWNSWTMAACPTFTIPDKTPNFSSYRRQLPQSLNLLDNYIFAKKILLTGPNIL